jgi:ATP-dependent DNA helicase PIF1
MIFNNCLCLFATQPIKSSLTRGRDADLLRAATLIILEELPMSTISVFECINNTLQRITGNMNTPFGGKVIIAVGDFRQVAPVIPNGGKQEVINASIKSSLLWSIFNNITLHTPIRYGSDPSLCHFVDSVGNGEIGPIIDLNIFQDVVKIDEAVDFLFPMNVWSQPTQCVNRAFLSPRNALVDEFNDIILQLLEGEEGELSVLWNTITEEIHVILQSFTIVKMKFARLTTVHIFQLIRTIL